MNKKVCHAYDTPSIFFTHIIRQITYFTKFGRSSSNVAANKIYFFCHIKNKILPLHDKYKYIVI